MKLKDPSAPAKTNSSTAGIGIGVFAPLHSMPLEFQIYSYGAKAAWSLQSWDKMEKYVSYLDDKSIDHNFLNAALNIIKGNYSVAQKNITFAIELLDKELTALVGESYQRAYNHLITIQQLIEMEEIIELKQLKNTNEGQERRKMVLKMWRKRLEGCQRDVDVWKRILQVRSLLISPLEDTWAWIKFSNLCMESNQTALARKTLESLETLRSSSKEYLYPEITLASIAQHWEEGHRESALNQLKQFSTQTKNNSDLQAKIYYKLGIWQYTLAKIGSENLDHSILQQVSNLLQTATKHAPEWQKAWHSWAMINLEAVEYYNKQSERKSEKIKNGSKLNTSVTIKQALHNAVDGFIKSMILSHGKGLQHTLRLLTLFFKYPNEVYRQIVDVLEQLEDHLWLEVIPQIIARIHTSPIVYKLLHTILIRIGKAHPQALVYPLTVASTSAERMEAAKSILSTMRQLNAPLIDQAHLVANELIRIAILWPEMWHEGLEESSKLYFVEHDVNRMFERLRPLHKMLEFGPTTQDEEIFHQNYAKELTKAWSWCTKYNESEKLSDLNKAWDIYYQVFKKLDKQLPTLSKLELHSASPRLLEANNMELAVPGTYKPGRPIVKIHSFNPVLTVISSKQRPRKLTIYGSDGIDRSFLLKGHEDLRQDERVMQLFGLVNAFLRKDARTRQHDLSIERYTVIPLSPNSGLIGWVDHSDTFHNLIKAYRQTMKEKIPLNVEHKAMTKFAPDYDKLSILQKVEVFEYGLSKTEGNDLERVLWFRSPNSELWILRRSNYTRSLAVMSMVGYILGLGDRHPSNLMLDRNTGKVIHIDFGDCFEVAMKRDKYPEKIPFRLTRMLVNAMEISGIEGNFRTTCENVLTLLREQAESLMAVLEAFVHDPLINWRLLNKKDAKIKLEGEKSKPTSREEIGATMYNKTHQGFKDSSSDEYSNSSEDEDERENIVHEEGQIAVPEELNIRALEVINRIKMKLSGRDFNPNKILNVEDQVENLILQATSVENLCQCYLGWCPFW